MKSFRISFIAGLRQRADRGKPQFRPPGADTAYVRQSIELFAREANPVLPQEATKTMASLGLRDDVVGT